MPRELNRSLALLAWAWAAAALPAQAAKPDDALREPLQARFATPEAAPLTLQPVVRAGAWGLVDWQQGERAGRALLRREAGQWTLVACGGQALRDPATLRAAGLPGAEARALASRLAVAERQASPTLSATLDRFPTLVQGEALAGHHHEHAAAQGAAAHAHGAAGGPQGAGTGPATPAPSHDHPPPHPPRAPEGGRPGTP